jgi:hypothetical protein
VNFSSVFINKQHFPLQDMTTSVVCRHIFIFFFCSMNKFTWMFIALVLAVAAGFLIKDANDQPVIMEVVNYIRAPRAAVVEVATGDVMATGEVAAEVATGTDTVVVDAAADIATGTEVADAAEVVATGTDTVVVDADAEVVATGTAQ